MNRRSFLGLLPALPLLPKIMASMPEPVAFTASRLRCDIMLDAEWVEEAVDAARIRMASDLYMATYGDDMVVLLKKHVKVTA